jgi:hypothetical protein
VTGRKSSKLEKKIMRFPRLRRTMWHHQGQQRTTVSDSSSSPIAMYEKHENSVRNEMRVTRIVLATCTELSTCYKQEQGQATKLDALLSIEGLVVEEGGE